MTTYHGHKNYNAWNVSLWINNDESLYREMLYWIDNSRTKDIAAQKMLDILHDMGITHTGDGVRYTKTNIRLAMRY